MSHSLVDQRRETWVLAAHRMSRERAITVITSPSRSPSTSLAAQGAFPGLASPTSTASEPSRRPNCGDQRDAEKGAKAKLSLSLREKEKESISPLLSLDLLLNLLVLSLSLFLFLSAQQASPSSTAGSPSAIRSSTSPSSARTSPRSTRSTST